MNFIDSFCSNIKKVIALIALMLLLTLVTRYFNFYAYIIRLFPCAAAHNTADYLSFT